jgi:peptidyl-prolyl cis-trans isomerase C
MKLLREPLVHFLFIGAAIYLAFGLFAEPIEDPQDNTLVVDAGEIEWTATSWYKRWKRLPTQQELDGLIQQYVRETILYRETLAMGLDRDDVIIRRRMAQKLEFLAQDLALMTPPTDEELQAYYPENSQVDIQKNFGSGFAESLVELSPEQWHGPVLSGYGTHLVYVHSISDPPPPVFADARQRVQQDWEDERRETMNEAFYAKLRDRYTIVIEAFTPEPEKVAAVQEQKP